MTFNVTVRYVCLSCEWPWTREVRSKVAVDMDRPIAVAKCPGCAEEKAQVQGPTDR